jgi:hypothetical protein
MVKKGRSLSKVVWPSSSSGPMPRHVTKVGRNDPCPCGSGTKYKDCHQKDGDKFLEKLARREDKRLARERRRKAKEQGVPWFKRIFIR